VPERQNADNTATERARAVALSRLAARHGVACGGTETSATLEALRGWLDAIRVDGDEETARRVEAELDAILASGPGGSR
jgi:hypothetical protein